MLEVLYVPDVDMLVNLHGKQHREKQKSQDVPEYSSTISKIRFFLKVVKTDLNKREWALCLFLLFWFYAGSLLCCARNTYGKQVRFPTDF